MGKLHYTIGTNKWCFSDWLETLKEHDITLVISVKRNNFTWVVPFKEEVLEVTLRENGIGYISLPDLGPTRKLRKRAKEDGVWAHFASQYTLQLMYNEITRAVIRTLLDLLDENEHCVLLCVETFPDRCHRRLLAEYITKFFPRFEFKHITPTDSRII